MVRNAFRLDIFREIKNTFGRFVAIFAIVLLGVAFFTGIGSTGVDMRLTGDAYFSDKNLTDIRVVSTYGINDNDLAAIRGVEGVEAVYPAYNIDALINTGDTQSIIKVHSLSPGAGAVNAHVLLSGRMPAAANEAVVERRFAGALGIQIGDTFTLESGKKTDLRDLLVNVRYQIVGVINSSYYVSNAERGSSSIGSGAADYYIYIPDTNFRRNVYSEAFVTVSGARGLQCFGDEYEDLIDEVVERLEDVGDIRVSERYIEATGGAYASLAAAEADLRASRAAADDEFDRLHVELGAAVRSLESVRQDLVIRQGELHDGVVELERARAQIRGGISALNAASETALAREKSLARTGSELVEAISALDREATGLVGTETVLRAFYLDNPEMLSGHMQSIINARSEISKNRAMLQTNLEAAFAGESAAREARAGINNRLEALEAELTGLLSHSALAWDGEIEIAGGYARVSSGLFELDRQMSQLTEQEAESGRLMDESLERVLAARKTLKDMDKPKWYVMDRGSNPGYSGFFGDADKVEAIGKVFPAIFFIVAALVCLTTMTRLVEERRTEIGTLKSLGYGGFKIMTKYLLYAAFPTLLGGFVGGLIGMNFFPVLIINTYRTLYTIPPPITVMNVPYWVVGMAIASLSTLGATVMVCSGELRAPPAILMRPKPPKRGARIFLERLPPLWNSISFTWKVTIRNIVRYKKRFFMTITGVAGCTALLMTAFGLRDSIMSMIHLQFGTVNQYDVTISFTDTAKQSDLDSVEALLRGSDIVRGVMPVRQKVYDAGAVGGADGTKPVNLVTPSDAGVFHNYVSIRDRLTREQFEISANGAIISEKLATQLNVGRGDAIYVESEGERFVMAVAGVVENYYLHYVYIHEDTYEELFGAKPENNAMYVLLGGHTEEQKRALTNSILEKRGVGALFLTSTVFNTLNSVLDSLNFVILVLIVSAAALALVVLLNLTNINISERKRELATIEVLGFFDREVSAYVYRENIVLTLIGAGAGLVFGIVMHSFVIRTAETDFMMFGRRINTESFIYSMVLTMVFASLVNIITGKKLRKIDMVEALKSVE